VNRDVYLASIIVGALPVIGALVRGGSIGAGVTLCMLMVGAGVIGLLTEARPRLPRARTIKQR
jgi:hypothetical protein